MDRSRRWGSPLAVAIGAGIALAGVTLAVHLLLARFEHGGGLAARVGMQLWMIGGAFLFGALPAYVSARYGLLSPAPLAVGLYSWTLIASWSAMVASAEAAGAGLTPTIFEIGLWYWPMALWLPLSVGGIEYAVRRAAGSRIGLSVENRT